MTPLLALLIGEPMPGLWRIDRFDPLQQDLVGAFNRTVLVIENLNVGDKEVLMDQLAAAFELPDWFGRNWDALYDSLADRASRCWPDLVVLSPLGQNPLAEGEGSSDNTILATLTGVLADVSEQHGQCFLIVGPAPPEVPELAIP